MEKIDVFGELSAKLRKFLPSGMRHTQERHVILKLICDMFESGKEYFTVDDIYNLLHPKESICLATIYNTLSIFEEIGFIERVPSLNRLKNYKLRKEYCLEQF